MILSLRQVSIQYGMNTSHINALTATGALTLAEGSQPLRPKYLRSQLDGLIPNYHP